MGRRQHHRLRERDEISAPGGGVAVRPAGKSLTDHVLSLQRDYGNTAVTGIVVQRAPKRGRGSMAASTDIKDTVGYKAPTKGPGKGAKKPAEEVSYFPTGPNPDLKGWKTEELKFEGMKWANGDKSVAHKGAEMLVEHFWREKDKNVGMALFRAYRTLGDSPRSQFWIGVFNGTIKK